jgi:DNA-binding MarR family transcriptional regulator
MAGTTKKNELILAKHLPYKIGRLRGTISKVYEDKCLAGAGVSLAGWRVLALVASGRNISATDVARLSGMRKMAVSRATTKLEQAGLIKRTVCKNDGRRYGLKVTRNGRRVYDSIVPAVTEFERRITQDLTRGDLKILTDSLRKILVSVEDLAASGDSLHD